MQERLLCEAVLYVSDTATESHYTPDNWRNTGAQIVDIILVDMTWLREKNVIKPMEPVPGSMAVRLCRVEYELVSVAKKTQIEV
jgi:hypothetical protein